MWWLFRMYSETSMNELQFKTNKKIMKNYNWEYFKDKINKKFSELKQKTIYSQRKFDVEPVFGFMKAILCYTRMSVRGINKAKRELGFVLMALDIRKVTAQRAENNQKFIKKTISIFFNRNCPYLLILELYVPAYLMLDDIVSIVNAAHYKIVCGLKWCSKVSFQLQHIL